jgi:hypothetical protein
MYYDCCITLFLKFHKKQKYLDGVNKNIFQNAEWNALQMPDMLHDDQRYGGIVAFSSISVSMR